MVGASLRRGRTCWQQQSGPKGLVFKAAVISVLVFGTLAVTALPLIRALRREKEKDSGQQRARVTLIGLVLVCISAWQVHCMFCGGCVSTSLLFAAVVVIGSLFYLIALLEDEAPRSMLSRYLRKASQFARSNLYNDDDKEDPKKTLGGTRDLRTDREQPWTPPQGIASVVGGVATTLRH